MKRQRIKPGTRVEVNWELAVAWGYKTPALGVVVGGDPLGLNDKVFAVKLDQGSSIFEGKGCHKGNLKVISPDKIPNGKAVEK